MCDMMPSARSLRELRVDLAQLRLEVGVVETQDHVAGTDMVAHVGTEPDDARLDLGCDRGFLIGEERSDEIGDALHLHGRHRRDRDGDRVRLWSRLFGGRRVV
jgi:hypothetical protein